jgi:hypothetical protein
MDRKEPKEVRIEAPAAQASASFPEPRPYIVFAALPIFAFAPGSTAESGSHASSSEAHYSATVEVRPYPSDNRGPTEMGTDVTVIAVVLLVVSIRFIGLTVRRFGPT